MGWADGAGLFDDMMLIVLPTINRYLTVDEQVSMVVRIISAFEDCDWDTPDDSRFWDHPVVAAAYRQLHRSWFKEWEANEM